MAERSISETNERLLANGVRKLFSDIKVVAKPLEWNDSSFIVHDDEGPTSSEAVGAGFHYLAEAVDMTLDEAKRESQDEFQANIEGAVRGVELPFIVEVERILQEIIRRAAPGPMHHGKTIQTGHQHISDLKGDVEKLAAEALRIIRSQAIIETMEDEGES
jgi:hypothetical protein